MRRISANSATNSEENFAFTITAQDTNLDSSTFKPVLTAVIPDEQGNYQTTEISLGEMTETPNGDKIASAMYSVENLERDAFYTLTCTVSDMVNHTNQNGSFALTDKEGNNSGEMEQVQFSINREGSTFHVTEQTDRILNDYYVKNLKSPVVIKETLLEAPSVHGEYTIKNGVKRISDYAFFCNDFITEVYTGDTVQEISSYAFYNCKNLKRLILGDSVTTLNYDMVYLCRRPFCVEGGKMHLQLTAVRMATLLLIWIFRKKL